MEIRFTIVDDEVVDFEEKTVIDETNENNSVPDKTNLFGISSLRFSIAARLISLMGGNIKLIDENQQRNIVTFTIKAKKVDEKVSEKILSRLKKAEIVDTTLASRLPLRIRVADDHEMNQVLMVQILGKLGYSCITARNGSEAAGLAIETKFDLIFMDIVMPVMDGIEATKRIREYYVQSNSPVIIGITANALMKESTRGFEAGMNDFLLKPYRPVDIQQAIKKWAPFVLKLDTEL
jgi:CheY-like chemotaxis protein